MRNAVGNQLYALAMGEGVCRKKQLFTKNGTTAGTGGFRTLTSAGKRR